MTPIQLTLLIAAAALLVIYFVHLRSMFLDRFVVLGLFLTLSAAIVWPNATSRIAHVVGVGRGADLVMYFYIMFSLFLCALLYGKIQGLEARMTEIVRKMAVDDTACREATPASTETDRSNRRS